MNIGSEETSPKPAKELRFFNNHGFLTSDSDSSFSESNLDKDKEFGGGEESSKTNQESCQISKYYNKYYYSDG